MKTRVVLEKLMKLPHRGAGTLFERKAAKLLVQEYKIIGLDAKLQNYSIAVHGSVVELFIPSMFFMCALLLNTMQEKQLAAIAFLAGLLTYLNYPYSFMNVYKWIFHGKSKNVIAKIDHESREGIKVVNPKTIVISGHYDTAPETKVLTILGQFYSYFARQDLKAGRENIELPPVPFFLKSPMFLNNLGVLLTLLVIILPSTTKNLTTYSLILFGFFCIVTLTVLEFLFVKYVPGAYDNGVGTSMVLDLAEHFNKKTNKLKHTNLIFLNTGSEEGPTRGMEHFMKQYKFDKENTYFLNLESIGAEIVMVCHGESSLPTGYPIEFDKKAFNFVMNLIHSKEEYKGVVKEGFLPACSDMLEVHKQKGKVITQITSIAPNGMPSQYHQMFDTIDLIKWDKVKEARALAIDIIEEFDKRFL